MSRVCFFCTVSAPGMGTLCRLHHSYGEIRLYLANGPLRRGGEKRKMKAVDHSLRGARILVAEDDAILALDVRQILRQAGAEIVGPAATLKQTLFLISTFPVSAALLDVNLRDGEVFPAARALEELGAGIVFYTGYADVDSLRRAWPGAKVLTKPAPPRLLISTMWQACFPTLGKAPPDMSGPVRSDPGARSAHREQV